MTLDIEKFKYYLRWYPFLYGADCAQWWFDPQTYTIIHDDERDSHIEKFHTRIRIMIPIPKVDIPMLEEKYLKSTGQEDVIRQLHAVTDSDFDAEFKKYVDHSCQLTEWYKFEAAHLLSIAKTWCQDNDVEYK
ncbi:MAG: hypothetical protein Q4G19_01150 [Clostridia bacterium]|nr:hypothetical protein [Clostridia bacterium]